MLKTNHLEMKVPVRIQANGVPVLEEAKLADRTRMHARTVASIPQNQLVTQWQIYLMVMKATDYPVGGVAVYGC